MKAIQTDLGAPQWILERVARAVRIPQPLLEKEAVGAALGSRMEIRRIIRDLLEDGRLMYTYELGTSFVCESYMGLTRLGRIIVVIPPLCSNSMLKPGEAEVVMRLGAAFGSGRHPTTRMAIAAIEDILAPQGRTRFRPGEWVLDVGSGTGILGLAALRLGMDKGVATDIDPCAVFDTRENAALNGMEHRLSVSDTPIPEIQGCFSLILANLRLPTLMEAMPVFDRVISRPGHMIVTGIQRHESDAMEERAREYGFECTGKKSENKWACMIFLQKTIRS
ncbi:Ribosomal protein L11 methyltransferase (PrmA) [Desulfatibacillum alkenivorans DSM 16219]|uniref:Ribosomal protein L11 methyltransferase (PrmA) n=1 Tax=Desulfatibacillum alkenivorans DSM 16219 TaxID=1121393 RepID=A0A1M6KDA6_9BACT|nr:50S ribosomal protein L11 methyltransferase [Desulfatibacillum alkenivorans]SHJ56912.1 Ribosomal protein L11 methyltransferase (PrmA) [Desulfatibacillum alkenivorans DSM 16219]